MRREQPQRSIAVPPRFPLEAALEDPIGRTPQSLTKAEQVAERLRKEISEGILPAGVRLGQRDVAARYGTSPTPVREALAQLAAEGIVVHTPNVGVTVADITAGSVEKFREVYLMRAALEGLATEVAHAHVSRAQLADLRRLQGAFEDAVRAGDAQGQRTLNYSFHMRIYRTAQAERLLRLIEQLWTLYPWETLWIGPDRMQSARDHAAILEALTSGTAEAASAAMAAHIEHGYETLLAYLRPGTDPAEGLTAGAPSPATEAV